MNHKRVARIRREDNLLCVPKLSFRPATTDSRHGWRVWPNLARQLVPMAVNQLWVADITYIRCARRSFTWLSCLDAFSRRVVGWAMAEHLRAELALSALDMAIGNRHVTPGAWSITRIRACNMPVAITSPGLERAGIQPSMSRPGCPWDNAMAESFMRTLKREEVNGQAYRDRAEAEASIGAFIETGLQPAAIAFGAGLSGAGGIRGGQVLVACPAPVSPGRGSDAGAGGKSHYEAGETGKGTAGSMVFWPGADLKPGVFDAPLRGFGA